MKFQTFSQTESAEPKFFYQSEVCTLRRKENRKKWKLILSIVRKPVFIYTKQGSGLKKSNLGHFPMRKWPAKWL